MERPLQPASTLWLWPILSVVSACGPEATFETFTLTLEDVATGQELRPLDQVRFHVVYKGDLARNLKVTATITDAATGESVTEPGAASNLQDSSTVDQRARWRADNALFKRPGRYEVTLTASIAATLEGSQPWTTSAARVFVIAQPRIDAVTLTPLRPGAPTPYGTPMSLTVSGDQLWDDVEVTLEDLDLGQRVPDLVVSLPSSALQAALSAPWTIQASSIEQLGVHRLQAVARFGPLLRRSEPFSLELTHLVNSVTVRYRDAAGVSHLAVGSDTRLDAVKDFVLEIHGTHLVGQEVQLDDEVPFRAPSDSFELIRVPRLSDFEAGRGVHSFDFDIRSGGVTRSDSVTLRRWKLEECAWRMADGSPLGSPVPLGAKVAMHARGWGFPDSSGFLLFKKDQAEFKLWERDDGQNNGTWQPLINNDDEVDLFKVDVLGSVALNPWTTVFDEELDFPLNQSAEYYFEAKLQDEKCTSGQISVPEK